MPKISVIIAAYNVEKFIQRCIDSVLRQSFTDYEIIIVNDCSTDHTLSVMQKQYGDNPKVKIFNHLKNQGQGIARNTGLDNVEGEYIFFLDSDDWIEPDMLEKLYELICEEEVDIAAAGSRYVYKDGSSKTFHAVNVKTAGGDPAIKLLANHIVPDMPWSKLYSRQFINKYKLRFPPIYYEDFVFTLMATYYCKGYVAISDELYNYYQNEQSTVNAKLNIKHMSSSIQLFDFLKQFLLDTKKLGTGLSNEAANMIYSSLAAVIVQRFKLFYQQTDPAEKNKILSQVFHQQFGGKSLFVQAMVDNLISENRNMAGDIVGQSRALREIELLKNNKKLNFVAERKIQNGWINVDSEKYTGINVVADIKCCRAIPLPFADNSISEILAEYVLEGVQDVLPLMEELYRIAVPSAKAMFKVKYGSNDESEANQMNVRKFFLHSFDYFSQPQYWQRDCGYAADWQLQEITLTVSKKEYAGKEIKDIFFAINTYRNVVKDMVVEMKAIKPRREPKRELADKPNIKIVLVDG